MRLVKLDVDHSFRCDDARHGSINHLNIFDNINEYVVLNGLGLDDSVTTGRFSLVKTILTFNIRP
jgi:hypothetical protein